MPHNVKSRLANAARFLSNVLGLSLIGVPMVDMGVMWKSPPILSFSVEECHADVDQHVLFSCSCIFLPFYSIDSIDVILCQYLIYYCYSVLLNIS